MKRIISLFLSIVMVFTILPDLTVSAATSGKCGTNATWTLSEGVLSISGSGNMYDYDNSVNTAPWRTSSKNINTITIENGITYVGEYSFAYLNSAKIVNIADSVQEIGINAFSYCSNITTVNFPDGLLTINKGAFSYCTAITDINIPNSVTTIGNAAFAECDTITSITIPNNIARIEYDTFRNCDKLSSIIIPASVTYMGSNAFAKTNIKTAGPIGGNYDLQFGWTESIPDDAFYGVDTLESIVLPDTITSIGSDAFRRCSSLKSMIIPTGVSTLPSDLFVECTSLTDVTIPDSVNKIEAYAFSTCSALETIKYAGSASQWNAIEKEDKWDINAGAYTINYGKYDIIVDASEIGNITVDKNIASIGDIITVTATANDGYEVKNILVDNIPLEGNTFTVAGDHTVSAEFIALSGYTVSLDPETNSVTDSETATIAVKIDAQDDITTYNAVDITLTYSGVDLVTDTVSGYTVTKGEGTVRIQGYGDDKAVGTGIDLVFANPDPTTGGTVILEKAYVDEAANAIGADAPEAQYGVKTATITHSGFSVNLSEDFAGEGTVPYGEDYTFTAKDNNYTYTFTATMGGVEKAVKDNGDGTFTVEDVTGPLVINTTKAPKTFTVTVNGNAKDDVTATGTPTYGTDFTFKVDEKEYYGYTVKVTVGGADYTYANTDGTYTIKGSDITSDIVITVEKELTTLTVKFEGGAAGAATGESTVAMGEDYEFTVNKEIGYEYTITAKMGEEDATLSESDGKYVIADVTANLVITIERELAVDVTVSEYVKIDSTKVFLVVAKGDTKDGDVLGYDGNPMYISEKYDGYAYLVIAEELTVEEAASKVAHLTATTTVIDNSGDVNCTGVIDINDAQLAYDIYNAKYTDFSLVSMEKFLRADVNDTIGLDVNDAVSVVAKIN